jgi:predicted acetyltransferase
MSGLQIVDVAPEGKERFVRTALNFLAETLEEDEIVGVQAVLDRALLARLDDDDVGAAAVVDYRLTMPGGGSIPMDGVTWVAVSPDARRRGALRAMMNHMLASARQRGIPLLGLGASESMIYRRFGYGIATRIGQAEIDTVRAAMRVPFTDRGRVRMQPLDGAVAVWLDIDRRKEGQVGWINRSEASWRRSVATGSRTRGAMSALRVAVHFDSAGKADGYVNYRVEERWPDELADGVLHVRELTALTREGHLALWHHVVGMDLMAHVRVDRHWLDDPIQHLLLDSRRLVVTASDDLHLRVVDVVAALEARRYAREDSIVLEVRDPACADIEGRYRLDGGLDGASASPTDNAADLVLDAPSLGAVMLGDTSLASLHRAGLVDEVTPGAVQRASAMFSWTPRPWLNHMF